MRRHLCVLSLAAALAGCSSGEIIRQCQDGPGAHAVCGFQNPEDLAPLDDGATLIVSQFGGAPMDGSTPGGLVVFDIASESTRTAYPSDLDVAAGDLDLAAAASEIRDADPAWGDPSCPGPPGADLSPHGIDLAHGPEAAQRLLVVNHGGREAVEFFQVTGRGLRTGLRWRGCALAPDDSLFNDLVNLPDGGFLVTRMMDRESQTWAALRSAVGADTGFVYEWQPGAGFRPVPGTAGNLPNGIELSADGREIYLNLYGAGQVRRISRDTGELLASVELPSPDNLSWARDGRLLVASHGGGLGDQIQCIRMEAGSCPQPFSIVALDPETLEAEILYENSGPPMGAGSVALDLGEQLVIGSYAGDRLLFAKPEVR